MPRRSVRARKRSLGFLYFAIGALVIAAVALICAIVITDRAKPDIPDTAGQPVAEGNFVDANDLPESEMVLKSDTFSEDTLSGSPQATPTPTPEPTDTPEPAPTMDPNDPLARLRPLPESSGMLAMFKKANTDEKVIAITLDECSGATIMGNFITVAERFGAKLTLFPTGESILKKGMDSVLRQCVQKYGFEIENRGYSTTAKLYQYPTPLMVQEIWKQSVALNFVLGVHYQPHFYRLYGGSGRYDPRTHAYLAQQGYYGIGDWSVSGTDNTAEKLISKLAPGEIFFFKSTPEDGQKMFQLMQAAKDAGYRMVTLNELFGYPANEQTQVQGSLLAETMPEFDYDPMEHLYDLFPGDAAWAVTLMQNRLVELGYLAPKGADGVFGDGTSEALRLFQAQCGQAASGAGDVQTQRKLYADDAPANPNPVGQGVPPAQSPLGKKVEEELVASDDPFAGAY